MRESTTVIAFDQHAASVVAAVLPAGAKTPLPSSRCRPISRRSDGSSADCLSKKGHAPHGARPFGETIERTVTSLLTPVFPYQNVTRNPSCSVRAT